MEEIFSMPWWESIGVITGGLLSIIALIIALRQNKKMNLIYSILYITPIIDSTKKSKLNDLELYFKGSIIENPYLTEIEIRNNGNIPIKNEDFEDSTKIEIQNCKRIISAKVTHTFPNNLMATLNYNTNLNVIELPPTSMNPKDFIRVQILFEGEKPIFKVFTRIIGLPAILEYKNEVNQNKADILWKAGMIGTFTTILILESKQIISLLKGEGNWLNYFISEFSTLGFIGMMATIAIYYVWNRGLLQRY